MLEREVEKDRGKHVKSRGGKYIKLNPIGNAGIMDRLEVYPIPDEEHRKIVAKYIQFTELKKPGEKLKTHQQRRKKRYEEMGYRVNVIDKKGKN